MTAIFAISLNNQVAAVIGDIHTLVTDRLAALFITLACINQKHLFSVRLSLIFSNNPNIGGNTCVIKTVIWKLNDGIQPIVFNQIAANFTRTASGIPCEKRGTVLNNSHASCVFQFRKTVQHKQHLSIGLCRKSYTESASIALFMFCLNICSFTLPVDTKRRVGNAVIKGIAGELVIVQGVTELHIFRVSATNQHISFCDTKSEWVNFLPIANHFCCAV